MTRQEAVNEVIYLIDKTMAEMFRVHPEAATIPLEQIANDAKLGMYRGVCELTMGQIHGPHILSMVQCAILLVATAKLRSENSEEVASMTIENLLSKTIPGGKES